MRNVTAKVIQAWGRREGEVQGLASDVVFGVRSPHYPATSHTPLSVAGAACVATSKVLDIAGNTMASTTAQATSESNAQTTATVLIAKVIKKCDGQEERFGWKICNDKKCNKLFGSEI